MDSPTETRPYSCIVCGKTFKNQYSIPQHLKIHNGIKKYQCVFCEVSFFQASSLGYHMNTHTGERPYQCRHCPRSFGRKCGLDDHILTVHSKFKKQLTCNLCDKNYRSRSGLVTHLRMHTGEMPYQCQNCAQRFRRSNDLLKHKEKGNCHRESTQLQSKPSRKKGIKTLASNDTEMQSEDIERPHEIPLEDTAYSSFHSKYECGHCLDAFVCSSELVLHLIQHKTRPGGLEELSQISYFQQRPRYLMWEKKMPILLPNNAISDYDQVLKGQACVVTPTFPQLESVY